MAFSCCAKLSNKQLFGTISRFPSVLNSVNYAQAAAGSPKITFKQYEPPKVEHHDVKNVRLNRPLSPHLTIYQVQLTSTLSITHRMTGLMLTGYATALGVGALFLPHDISHYISIVESLNLSPATLLLMKAVIASPLGYHFANGIRHLYWDAGKGLSIKEVYQTGYAMLALATIISLGLAAL